jgi:Spy/CpxP family protein refolding chaperone
MKTALPWFGSAKERNEMNTNFRRTVTSTVALGALVLAVAATAAAQPWGGHPPGRHGGPGGGPLAGLRLLDLSEEQEAAVRDLVQQHRKAAQPIREQQRARMRQIHELAATPGADPASIGRLVIEAEATHKQMRAEQDKLKESVGALLTPEQRELWTRLEAAHKKARERGRGFGPGPGRSFFGPDGESEE